MGWWGPHFPRVALGPGVFSYPHWGKHFPEGIPAGTVPPIGAGGAGTFELQLEDSVKVTYAWQTGIAKAYRGTEKRSSIVEDPAVRYEGEAVLSIGETRAARSRLARFAAPGAAFLLGLPYEALSIKSDSTGLVANVESTASRDWAVPGQRVLVQHSLYGSKVVTVQSTTANTITVATSDGLGLGNVGLVGALIMPCASIFLDAQQGFARHQTKIERWQLRARNADVVTETAFTYAKISLESLVVTPALKLGSVVSRFPATNGATFQLVADGFSVGSITEDISARTVVIHYQPGVTPIVRIGQLLATSVHMQGTGFTGPGTIAAGDAFGPVALVGGVPAQTIVAGTGATLTTFAGRPIWDRGTDIEGTVGDSMQAMNDPMDLGGLPFTAQTATYADWGRQIAITRRARDEWQWVKKFLWTVKGRWKSFWLPSYRADLVAVSVAVGTLTIQSGELAGDFFAWYPGQRSHLVLTSTTGVSTYVRISAATDNGNGTVTLTIVDGAGAAVSIGALPAAVSWMDLCHLESDQVDVTFNSFSFSINVQARVVSQ